MAVAAPPSYRPSWLQRVSSTTSTLTIPNRVNHRRTLLDVFVEATNSGFVDIKVGNVTMLRVYDRLANARFIAGLNEKFGRYGFLWFLSDVIPNFPALNASQDEPIVITRSVPPTSMHAYFADTEGGDVTSRTLPGGSLSTIHPFILNLSNANSITASGRFPLSRLDMPEGLTLFSDGTRMAPNIRFTLYMLAANMPANGGTRVSRVHIFDEMIELFTSENGEGLLPEELAFDLSPLTVFRIDPPYVFEPNRIVTFFVDVAHDGTNNLAAGSQQLFLIGTREYLT
jgi:hypothetical protein